MPDIASFPGDLDRSRSGEDASTEVSAGGQEGAGLTDSAAVTAGLAAGGAAGTGAEVAEGTGIADDASSAEDERASDVSEAANAAAPAEEGGVAEASGTGVAPASTDGGTAEAGDAAREAVASASGTTGTANLYGSDAQGATPPAPATPGMPEAPVSPRFDLVRADRDGMVVVAGTAAPGSEVEVLIDGALDHTASADSAGRFASFLDLPQSPQPRVLRLRSRLDGVEVDSDDEIIIAPASGAAPSDSGQAAGAVAQAGAEDAVTEVVAEQNVETSDGTGADAASDEIAAIPPAIAPETPDLGTAPAEGTAGPATPGTDAAPEAGAAPGAPAVLRSTEAGIEVLPSGGPPDVQQSVAIDAVTYDAEGGVEISGRGVGDSFLRIYLDNAPITTSRISADGRWRARLPQVDTGTYTLRVDQIDAEGAVTARAESPFLREDPQRLARAAEGRDGAQRVQAVIIQPGNTLWAIARHRYGEGLAYVRIYEANKGQIRDPDLIYPGQLFSIPN
ncbi:hypothetical protein Salmuc_05099 [Salipiger mucosus DSM 16094]|uniref:LysM domain-containing protein n=1 Tax=Salipiger mucosus DSM 16094 TaxID=1123237 RepID=S9QPB5_9RHOB|nr:hypothetical protein Salmuc_05099 [Salipiger mucosus DSM 16094]